MKFIAHRGNITGPSGKENNPEHVKDALKAGFDAEVDVWYIDNRLYLGHDVGTYKVDHHFLRDNRIWCHAKTIPALEKLLELDTICFFHNEDNATLTSNGYIWTYPRKPLTEKSICVMPEQSSYSTYHCAGICSDDIQQYKNLLER